MKVLLIFLLLTTTLFAKKKEDDISFNTLEANLFSAGVGSFFDGEFSAFSLIYRTSFPGVGIKLNPIEMSIPQKSDSYTCLFVPYLLIPLRAHKKSDNNSLFDGEVEFFGGIGFVNSIAGREKNGSSYYVNGGISVSKMFDIFKMTSVSLKIGYKSIFHNKISADNAEFNRFYGMIVLNNHILKTHENHINSIKAQNNRLSVSAEIGRQFYISSITIGEDKIKGASSLFYKFSFTRPISNRLSFMGNYSNFGEFNFEENQDSKDEFLKSDGHTVTVGVECKTINANSFKLPISVGIGGTIINNIEYKINNNIKKNPTAILPTISVNIKPTYTLPTKQKNLSVFASTELNNSFNDISNLDLLLGYNFGGGLKIEF